MVGGIGNLLYILERVNDKGTWMVTSELFKSTIKISRGQHDVEQTRRG